MKREELMLACCSDIAGKVRGKAFPLSDFDKRARRGIGWTPTNVQITCFDAIADSPYGALGDLVLIPDQTTRTDVDFEDGTSPERFIIGDIRETDGTPWECCTRSILASALERLKSVTGLTLVGAFEHEFHFRDKSCPLGSAYTTAGFRTERAFMETLIAVMRDARIVPDTFMKEYGIDQYEVTMGPAEGLRGADNSIILREIIHTVAQRFDSAVSFTPLRDPAGVGNGVHIHMSFRDADGNPATYDPAGRHGQSKITGSFVAGILKHLDAIVAITAPSVVSYTRLTPHRWSAAFNNLGFRDREAAVRICPVSDVSDVAKAAQYNFEFRAGDAAASPYLQLAAIVHAGVQGVEENLAAPDATQEDLSLLSSTDLAAKGYVRLPQTLEAALERFSANDTVTSWFPGDFADIYVKHKQGEIAFLENMSEAEICQAYEEAY